MDIDPDTAYLMLDFCLRQPLEDRTLSNLLRNLPISNDRPKLKISLLLRKLESDISQGSISESVLELLEQIEELLFQQGTEEVSDRMKSAYCAVAVDCTVRYLGNWNKRDSVSKYEFLEAVKRVWRERVGRMKKTVEKGGLGSEELWGWKEDMEDAAWGEDGACENVMKRSAKVNAVEAVRAYLREEWERIGPPFIDLVDQNLKGDKLLIAVVGTGCGDAIAGKQETICRAGQSTDANKNSKEVLKEKSHPQGNSVGYNRSRRPASGNSRGVKITDSDEMTTQSSDTVSGMAGKSKNHDPVEVNHVEANHLDVDSARVVQTTGCNGSNVNRPSLMERNSSARTYQWDESIDGSQAETSDRRCRPQLPSPKNIRVSPLVKYETKTLKKRRTVKRWSPVEEDTLRTGVEKHGRGNWKVILSDYHHIFDGRTEVDLKDKWRNMTR